LIAADAIRDRVYGYQLSLVATCSKRNGALGPKSDQVACATGLMSLIKEAAPRQGDSYPIYVPSVSILAIKFLLA
jgi:hypothetical protein